MALRPEKVIWEDCWKQDSCGVVGPEFVSQHVLEQAWYYLMLHRDETSEITFLGSLDAMRRTGRAALAEYWRHLYDLEYDTEYRRCKQ